VGDKDLKMLKSFLSDRHTFEMPIATIEEAVTVVSDENRFHPIREYLAGLQWDGVKRIDTWLTVHLGADDTPYTRAVARKMLCAAVARVLDPGCQWDYVPILEGGQGCGKSTTVRILAGNNYVADFTLDPHSRDTVGMIQGRWMVEMAEMEVKSKTDADAMKAFITRRTDVARLAYDRKVSEFPRQFIIIATKNPANDKYYLKDPTGNRRWWPVACAPKGKNKCMDFDALKAVRDQLWAEAVIAQKTEVLHMETPELVAAQEKMVRRRQRPPEWAGTIGAWIRGLDAEKRKFILTCDIFTGAMGGMAKSLDAWNSYRIAEAMSALGWELEERMTDGILETGFVSKTEDIL
jgi:predicted P-loop ATPase